MQTWPTKNAVLFIVFNRPDVTSKVFETIRQARPSKLFIAADGPRKEVLGEFEKTEQVKKIVNAIDWPCEVKTLFQKENLGCGYGVSTAINWFFDNVEEGIILEDDCLPSLSFFRFCDELLEHYRNNKKIMHISGNNFQYGKKRGVFPYYFSEFTHIWGWATWRRAWKHYDFNCVSEMRRKTNWDRQWLISVRKQNGLAILPNINLVSNIGFGEDGTHTIEPSDDIQSMSCIPVKDMEFPLTHPILIRRNLSADFLTYQKMFRGTLTSFLFQETLRIIPSSIKNPIKKSVKKSKNP